MKPPRIATWLLTRFISSEALIGDLAEGLAAGRSPNWYRRQAVFAVIGSVFADLRHNRSQVFRAALMAWGGMKLVMTLAAPVIESAGWKGSPKAILTVLFFGSAAMGWMLVRPEPSERASTVLIAAMSFAIPMIPSLIRLVMVSLESQHVVEIR